MHLVVLLVVDLVEQGLPVVVEVEEKLLVLDHLGLSVQEHGSSLSEVLSGVEEVAHSVVVEGLSDVLKDVDSVDDDALSGLEEELLWVEEGLGHSLDLLIVVVVDLSTVVEHVTEIGDRETHLVDGLGDLLVGSVPEAAHSILEVLFHWVDVSEAVSDISHAVEVESSDEETLNKARDLHGVVWVGSLSSGHSECCSKRGLKHFRIYFYNVHIQISFSI